MTTAHSKVFSIINFYASKIFAALLNIFFNYMCLSCYITTHYTEIQNDGSELTEHEEIKIILD